MRGRMPQFDPSPIEFSESGQFIQHSGSRIPLAALLVMLVAAAGGCTSLFPGKPDESDKDARMRKLLNVPKLPDLIRDATAPQGTQPIQIDGVGVVNHLPGTGGPTDPSVYRDQLIEEMKRHDIVEPNEFLESTENAMVRVRAIIPPGARRGDVVDIRILAPAESRAASLRGGWLLDTRLRQQQVLQRMIRQSDVMAIGKGAVVTRADYEAGSDAALQVEGSVLSGGSVQISRNLGLVLRPEYQHVKIAAAMAGAINRRFFFFDGTTRGGIATAKEDDFIEIEVHPRYRDNIGRMMEVIRAVGGNPDSTDKQSRLAELSQQLKDPAQAADAALQLEALGDSAVPTLLEGLQSPNQELSFYAAEALAYLDRNESIKPLAEAARDVPAFRHSALLALQGLQQAAAVDALHGLMDEPSIETRYGSFCTIRRRLDGSRTLARRNLGPLQLYEVPSTAPAAVVVSLREESEIVLFGSNAAIEIPDFLRTTGGFIVKPDPSEPSRLRISRFRAGEDDRQLAVSNSIAEVVEGVVATGGGYGDVIALLRAAKDKGYLADQLAIDPLPKSLRTYYRDEGASESPTSDGFEPTRED